MSGNASAFVEQSAFSMQSACGLSPLSTSDEVAAKNGSMPMVSAHDHCYNSQARQYQN